MRAYSWVFVFTMWMLFLPSSAPAAARFAAPSLLFSSTGVVTDVAAGDFNGDGILDAVASTSVGLAFFPGDADGVFLGPLVIPGGSWSRVVSPDLDRDGRADAVAGARGGGNVLRIFRGSPLGLVADVAIDPGTSVSELASGDLNGDGIPDLVVAGANVVSVLLGTADGHLGAPHLFDLGFETTSLVLADLNGDGKLDVAVHGGSYYGFVTWALGDGAGGLGATRSVQTVLLPRALAAADGNGDGKLDLLFTGGFDATLGFLPGHGDGSFDPAQVTSLPLPASKLVARDLDGDARADLLAAGGNQLLALFSNGNGTYRLGRAFDMPWYLAGLALADFDRDGVPDVLAGNDTGGYPFPDDIVFMRGHAGGTFGEDLSFATGNRPQVLTNGDLDGDGHLDVVTANLDGGSLSTLRGHGDGTYGAPTNLPVQGPVYPLPIDVKVADVNEDGRADLLFTQIAASGISVFLQQANGGWGPQTTFSTGDLGAQEWRFNVADLNGDAHLDVVAAAHYSPVVSVLLGRGDGTFGPAQLTTVGSGPFEVALADVNHDHHQDALVSDVGSYPDGQGGLWFLPGVGDGTFGASVRLHGSATASLVVDDLDQDGNLDVAAWADTSVLILRGDGVGGFGPDQWLHLGYDGLWGVVAGDFALDGSRDLATVDIVRHAVAVGDRDGAWQAALGVKWNPTSIVAADLDEDGKTDLAVANSGANSVTVLLNRSQAPTPPPIQVPVVARMGSCPGRVSLHGQGVLPVVLPGGSSFDIDHVVKGSVTLGDVAPLRTDPIPRDAVAPDPGDACGCGQDHRDGFADLVFWFDQSKVAEALRKLPAAEAKLTLRGRLVDGASFEGQVCFESVGARGRLKPQTSQGDGTLAIEVSPSLVRAPEPVQFRLQCPESDAVQFDIYTATGRHVASLIPGDWSSGSRRVTWDGRADDGFRATSGLYFARALFAERSAVARFILVR